MTTGSVETSIPNLATSVSNTENDALSSFLTSPNLASTNSLQPSVLASVGLSTITTLSTITATSNGSKSAPISAPTSKVVEVVMTATPSAGTVTIVTPSPTGKIEPNPIFRNKAAIIGVIIAGVLVVVGGILVFLYALRKRRKRFLWRTRSPDKPYPHTERSGRVLIRGHSANTGTLRRPLAEQEWQPPLVSEVGEGDEREDEDEHLYSDAPVILPMVQKEQYGSIMAAVHSYSGLLGGGDLPESSASSIHIGSPLPKAGGTNETTQLISTEETPPSVNSRKHDGDIHPGWVQADVSTPGPFADPFADPEPKPRSLYSSMSTKYRPLSQSTHVSNAQVFAPSLSQLPSPVEEKPNRLRGGIDDSVASIHSANAADAPLFNPFAGFDLPSRPSSLLNPPTRPKFTGTLTDLVLSTSVLSASSAEPPVLPPIPPVALPTPGESIDSYLPDGLLDPALSESRSLRSVESGPRIGRESSSSSLVDHVDYTRPLSSIIFHRPPTVESCMDVGEESNTHVRDEIPASAAVQAYHDKLLGPRKNS
ncbi:hypothetical protein F5878DRAFT_645814 [Lentinula raphanica]|uniref:Uncharacterized protein n=1 Tax=Lentinula raphanica TaxID=153919 RepID=A0AA38U770_9AGAR|nr:hypothetical protein F5878DRAFT_645814 [Lentinula raphanica]